MSIVFDLNLKIFKENGKELTSKDLTHVKNNCFIMNSIPDRDVVSMYNKIFYLLFFAIWLDEEIKYNNGYSDTYIYASIPNKTENQSYKIYNGINSKEEYKQRIISLEKYNKYCFDDNIYFNLYKNMISDILKEEPFQYTEDTLIYKVHLMIWKKKGISRIVEIETFTSENADKLSVPV